MRLSFFSAFSGRKSKEVLFQAYLGTFSQAPEKNTSKYIESTHHLARTREKHPSIFSTWMFPKIVGFPP